MKKLKFFFLFMSCLCPAYVLDGFCATLPFSHKRDFLKNQSPIKKLSYVNRQVFNDFLDEKLIFLKLNSNKRVKSEIEPLDQARDLVDAEIANLLTSVTEIHGNGLSESHLESIH